MLANNDAVLSGTTTAQQQQQANQLPFYKRPRPNAYIFASDDFEHIPVVQHRFKPRPPYVPPPDAPRFSLSQITDGGEAQLAGIQLGDSIVGINGEDTGDMSLAEAHRRIEGGGAADGELRLSVKKFAEDEHDGGGQAQEVSLREDGHRPQVKLSADKGNAYFFGIKQRTIFLCLLYVARFL